MNFQRYLRNPTQVFLELHNLKCKEDKYGMEKIDFSILYIDKTTLKFQCSDFKKGDMLRVVSSYFRTPLKSLTPRDFEDLDMIGSSLSSYKLNLKRIGGAYCAIITDA